MGPDYGGGHFRFGQKNEFPAFFRKERRNSMKEKPASYQEGGRGDVRASFLTGEGKKGGPLDFGKLEEESHNT